MTPYWDSLLADPFPEVKLCFFSSRRGNATRGKDWVWDFSRYLIEWRGGNAPCPGITGAG